MFDNLVTGSYPISHDKLSLNEEAVITLFHTKMFSGISVFILKHLKGFLQRVDSLTVTIMGHFDL